MNIDEGDSRAINALDTYIRIAGFSAWQYAYQRSTTESETPVSGYVLVTCDPDCENGVGVDAPSPIAVDFVETSHQESFDPRTHFAVAVLLEATPLRARSFARRVFSRYDLPWTQGPLSVVPEFVPWLLSYGKLTARQILETWRRFVHGDPYVRLCWAMMLLEQNGVATFYLDENGLPNPLFQRQCIESPLFRRDRFRAILPKLPASDKAALVITSRIDKSLLDALPRDFELCVGVTMPVEIVDTNARVLWCPFAGPGSARCENLGCVRDANYLPMRRESGLSVELKCQRCKTISYCSRECQIEDWRRGHRAVCKAVAAIEAAAPPPPPPPVESFDIEPVE